MLAKCDIQVIQYVQEILNVHDTQNIWYFGGMLVKRLFIVKTPEQLRAISDPLRGQMLVHLIKSEYTGKQLADVLEISASKAHYHLKELEHTGFIEVVRTEEKNGIVQKFFRAVAFDFKFDDVLLPSLKNDSSIAQEIVASQFRMGIRRVYEAPEESFRIFEEEEKRPPMLTVATEVKASRADLKAWVAKYHALLGELGEMAERFTQRVEAGEEEDKGEIFYTVAIGFMTTEQMFQADDMTLPEDYDVTSKDMLAKKKEDME